ncbi:MAG TPA: hypothetical protein VN756_13255 [Solirubrobacterales bacterium]|nr:hypothetical protein [Solirubrobacterales bacterium]
MARPVRIGNRPMSFRERAEIALETALAERDIAPDIHFEKPSAGSGIVAVVVDGEKRLFHLGTDEGDAMFRLARLASRPAGREG